MLLAKVVKLVAPIIFKQVGGEEAEIGSKIGRKIFGPIGAMGGGLIGSFFGSCNRYCAYDYVPVPTRL